MLDEEVYLRLRLEVKKSVASLPEEESCDDLPLLAAATSSLPFSWHSLEKVPHTEHKAIPTLHPSHS